ncbi:MAG: GMC family oxidoreductase [Sorangiineae bacterium]|nr:GMC family oxidoreductase [Polyangiaceae bacterium]MEB2324399.1 GMC family oxidoreductase [Sorangiineae bacterium]
MTAALTDSADFVVVGTGAGGATAARVLAAAGHSVIMVEEGPRLAREERAPAFLDDMSVALRDMGTQTTVSATPMPLLQGRLVGGSTAINSGIVWRMPDDVRADWTERFGLGELVRADEQERIYGIIEDELEVAETRREVLGGNSLKMEAACRALGLPGQPMRRNARRCTGHDRTFQGCPGDAHQSMDVSYVPRALRDGARLHADARVERVTSEAGRATGVVGDRLDREGRVAGRFDFRARRGVVVAAGAIHTPVILLRSGLRGLVGERFQAHPGAAVVGRFADVIDMSFGAAQGYEVPMRADGFKLESLALPPEMLAARLPGAGPEWQERLAALDHFGQWVAETRMRAHGRVSVGWGGKPVVRYEPSADDLRIVQRAIALIARMMFAAGATEVYPGVARLPEVLTRADQVELIERAELRRADLHLLASHLFGTACAHADPSRGVVGPNLEAHALPGLFVMDASVFPTNLGVNPQHSIMTVVWRAAEQLALRGRAQRTA